VHPIRANVAVEADVGANYREFFRSSATWTFGEQCGNWRVQKISSISIAKNLKLCSPQNVTGAMLMAREAANISSSGSAETIVKHLFHRESAGVAQGTAYYASKFALRGMSECWRAELRKFNVRVFS